MTHENHDDVPAYMPVEEFRRLGYLQEANRLFFHPLGLALSTILNGDGTETFGPIWDGRDDPEGWIFGPDMIDADKARAVGEDMQKRVDERYERLGFGFQPPPPA